MATLYLVAAAFLCLSSIASGQDLCETTPDNFRTLYIEECVKLLNDTINCPLYWNTFAVVFARRDPSSVVANDYDPYFQQEPFRLNQGPDTTLFWSRTPELVKMLSCMCASGANVVSSFNSPGTAIVNNVDRNPGDIERIEVHWCGTTDPNSDGIDYDNRCPCSVAGAFFERFSVLFAQAGEGTVFYLTYGQAAGGSFRADSFFALYEIPNLNPAVVNRVVVMVVHQRGMGESCGNGTLATLEQTLRDQLGEFTYTCIDLYGDLTGTDADVQRLTNCTMGVIANIQEGSEPESSIDCSSALPGVQLSLLAIAVALVISVFA